MSSLLFNEVLCRSMTTMESIDIRYERRILFECTDQAEREPCKATMSMFGGLLIEFLG